MKFTRLKSLQIQLDLRALSVFTRHVGTFRSSARRLLHTPQIAFMAALSAREHPGTTIKHSADGSSDDLPWRSSVTWVIDLGHAGVGGRVIVLEPSGPPCGPIGAGGEGLPLQLLMPRRSIASTAHTKGRSHPTKPAKSKIRNSKSKPAEYCNTIEIKADKRL